MSSSSATSSQAISSSSSTAMFRSSAKIPPFDENNFAMWKTKALMVLETMDYNMMEIVNTGPYVPTFQPMKDNVPDGPRQATEKHAYTEDDKRMVMLDTRAHAAIGNALPYNIYHLVQNAESAKAMMDALTVAYEGTAEVTETQKNNLNRKYEHFFALTNESLTDTFNRFNCLYNDMQRLGC